MKRPALLDWAAVAFAVLLFVFSLARARNPLRWSAWAMGDAQNLSAALHFANEGFLTHKFLTYNHPGYLGRHSRNESNLGYEPHYPSLSAAINGALIRRFGENLALLRGIAIAFSVPALLLWYAVCRHFFVRPVALAGMVFIGASVSYLEFVDCLSPYSYSEFFRLGAMASFLYSERLLSRRKAWASGLFIGLTWILTFLEAMNSNDYIVFLQIFFVGYYILDRRRPFPYLKCAILASAAAGAFALRFYQISLVLGSGDAVQEWTSRSLLSGEKTAPLQKGIGAFLSFWTYFARTMEDHMVRSNFGFGFGAVFLMLAWCWALLESYGDRLFAPGRQSWTLGRVFLLFLVPSLSWWILFSNHTAAFFYTPRHIYPFLGALLGTAFYIALRAVREKRSPFHVWAGGFALAGILWSPVLLTGKYLKEYPNLINPQARAQMGDWKDLTTQDIGKWTENFEALREVTDYGDVIIFMDKRGEYAGDFFEYPSQRRLEFAESLADLQEKRRMLLEYRNAPDPRYPVFGPFSVYALTTESTPPQVLEELKKKFSAGRKAAGPWTLWKLI